MTVAAVGMEIPLPFLFWFRKTRPYACLLGVALHLWIMVFMVIPVFGIVMIASYLAFAGEADLDRAIERLSRRVAPRRAKLLLDTASRMGARWSRVIPLLDVLGRVQIEAAPQGDTGGPRLVTADGRTRVGFRAWVWILPRLLAVFGVIPALYLPERTPSEASRGGP
jgi:hypothetical protein